MTLLDFKSVSMHGAHNFGRVRVLWQDGLLKAFDKHGKVLEIAATEPVKKKGYIRTWEFVSIVGKTTMRGRCMTCGGSAWWKMLWEPGAKLWQSA